MSSQAASLELPKIHAASVIQAVPQATMQRVLNVRASLLTDFPGQLLRAFGATSAYNFSENLLSGAIRPGDDLILLEVAKRITNRFDQAPLRILEFSAGRTYGENPLVGAPWLARVLARAFGEVLEITISDFIEASERCYFYVNEQGCLYSNYLVSSRDDLPLSNLTLNSDGSFVFEPIDFGRLRADFPKVAEEIERLSCRSGSSPVNSGRLFLRPKLDGEFEWALFGLAVNPVVDRENLRAAFAESCFDTVFGRFLFSCPERREIEGLKRAMRAVLTPGGYGQASFDSAASVSCLSGFCGTRLADVEDWEAWKLAIGKHAAHLRINNPGREPFGQWYVEEFLNSLKAGSVVS